MRRCRNCGDKVSELQETCFLCGHSLHEKGSTGWLFYVGGLAGARLFVHKSLPILFLLGLLWEIALLNEASLVNFLVFSLLWASVLLVHEGGHILVIRGRGLTCGKVVLHLFPVFSVQEWQVRGNPRDLARVALGGPLMSLAVAAICWLLSDVVTIGLLPLPRVALFHAIVGTVNLFPVWPLDGALFFRRLDSPREEAIAPQAEEVPRKEAKRIENLILEELDAAPREETPPEALTDVDAILEKIFASGLHSLTEQERSILHEASRNLRR